MDTSQNDIYRAVVGRNNKKQNTPKRLRNDDPFHIGLEPENEENFNLNEHDDIFKEGEYLARASPGKVRCENTKNLNR